MSKKSKKQNKKLDAQFEEYWNEISLKLFNKPLILLQITEYNKLYEYINDLRYPKWKILQIHSDGTLCIVGNIGIIKDINNKELKEYISSSGYKTVWIRSIRNSQECYPKLIHRLVAEAFVKNPDPENKIEVHHIDNNSLNCWYKNLQWVTHQENIQYSIDAGHQPVGMNHKQSKWTDDQIHQVCKMLEDPNILLSDIVKATGVSIKTIKHIRFDNGWHDIAKNYNIDKSIRNQGPRFSSLSLKIMDLIQEGKTNSDIKSELRLTESNLDISDKNLSDRIRYLRTKII